MFSQIKPILSRELTALQFTLRQLNICSLRGSVEHQIYQSHGVANFFFTWSKLGP